MNFPRSLSSNELAKLSGLTLRQLQNMDECGVLCPPVIGHRRQYSDIQARLAVVAGYLDRRGIRGQGMYRAIRMINASLLGSGFLVVSASARCASHLQTQNEVISFMAASTTAAWVIDLNRIALPLAA